MQIHRIMQSLKVTDENEWLKTRVIAYEVARKGAKNPPMIEQWMPIGDELNINNLTEEELDDIWRKFGKRKRN